MPPAARDRLGRPLPAGHPDAFPPPPERTSVTAAAALREADGYLADGLPFHAHEVLEARWRCAPTAERPLWRALAQWAAAVTHAARGNPTGAHRLAARAGAALVDWQGPHEATARAASGHCVALTAWSPPRPVPAPPPLAPPPAPAAGAPDSDAPASDAPDSGAARG